MLFELVPKQGTGSTAAVVNQTDIFPLSFAKDEVADRQLERLPRLVGKSFVNDIKRCQLKKPNPRNSKNQVHLREFHGDLIEKHRIIPM